MVKKSQANDAVSVINNLAKAVLEESAKKPKYLPYWGDYLSAAPYGFFRSSLFTARLCDREYYEEFTEINVLGRESISYKGEELRTDDEDVFLAILSLAQDQDVDLHSLTDGVVFSINKLAKKIIRSKPSKKFYEKVNNSITRLADAHIKIKTVATEKHPEMSISFRLFDSFIDINEDNSAFTTPKYKIFIGKQILLLLVEGVFGTINMNQRKDLNALQKKLHSYFGTHKIPKPVKVSSLHSLIKSGARLSDFKNKLPQNLDKLIEVGFLKSYDINKLKRDDLVKVTRKYKKR